MFSHLLYRLYTFFYALYSISRIKQSDLEILKSSYSIFDKEKIESAIDHESIINYYNIIRHFCALGNVEKMYIPPMIDPKKGVYENQLLYEKEMMSFLQVKPNDNIIDIGCGKGRIAHHVADVTNACVYGLNIDQGQIDSAKEYARITNFDNKTVFIKGNYNDGLPFPDNYFDAGYQVQAFTYVNNLDSIFSEMYRVLKPGARFVWIDWVVLDKYDSSNKEHVNLVNGVKYILGAVYTDYSHVWVEAMKKAGFNVIIERIPGIGNVQYPLIQAEIDKFTPYGVIGNFLVKYGILPEIYNVIIEHFGRNNQDLVYVDKMGLATTVYQIILNKPKNDN